MTTANKITITRILLIPVFVMMAIYYGRGVQRGDPQEWQRWGAIAIFVLAAASDGIDGVGNACDLEIIHRPAM